MYSNKNFAIALLGSFNVVMGQLPRECFYVTEMHGP